MHGQGGVDEQLVLHVGNRGAILLADQQGVKTRAVEEEVAFDVAAVIQGQRRNVIIVVRAHCGDAARYVFDAQSVEAMGLQEVGEFAGIEMIGIVGDRLEIGRRRHFGGAVLIAQGGLEADEIGEIFARFRFAPNLSKIELVETARHHEGMVVGMTRPQPVLEARGLFEGGVAGHQEIGLGYAHGLQRVAHAGPGAFTDADRGDVRGFDQDDLEAARMVGLEARRQGAGGHPAGGAASGDDDFTNCIHGSVPAELMEFKGYRAAGS